MPRLSLEAAFASVVAAEWDQRSVTECISDGWELRGDPPTHQQALLYLLSQAVDWSEFDVIRKREHCDDAVTRLAYAARQVIDKPTLQRELARLLDRYIPRAVKDVSAEYAAEEGNEP